MLYASLVNSLRGVYYPVPTDDETMARLMLNNSDLAKLWFTIYTRAEVEENVKQFGGVILPDGFAKKLHYDSHKVHMAFGVSET